jgi:L-fuculose-phosphate aldolase
MISDNKILPGIIDVCHRLYEKGFVAATDGNVSVRLPCGHILTTRTAVNKGAVTEKDIIEVDQSGNPIDTEFKPSTELGMHLFIYSQRPDVQAVVHAHPPFATGFATAREPLRGCLFPEVIVGLGAIPLAEYATPSTKEVSESLAPYIKSADAILLANHGVVTCGTDIWDAYYKMEKVEHAAQITLIARLLGGETVLSAEEVEKLRAISEPVYGKNPSARLACEIRPEEIHNESNEPEVEDPREMVRRMIRP